MLRFNDKAEGRIFTDKLEHIDKIKNIIHEMNEGEFDYLPKDLITTLPSEGFIFRTVYNGKFYDLDLNELRENCAKQNIPVWFLIADNRVCECGDYYNEVHWTQMMKFVWQLYLDGQRTKEQITEYFARL